MSEWMKLLLSLSLSGTLLLLALLALKQVYKNRFSKCWQYYILLAAVLRFLVPFAPQTTLVGLAFGAAETVINNEKADFADDINYTEAGDFNIIKTDNTAADGIQSVSNNDFTDLENHTPRPSIAVGTCVFVIWLAVMLALLVRKITIYQSFLRYIKVGNQAVSDIETLNILSDCEETLHMNKTVELYQNPFVTSPIAVGFFRPRIILPVKSVEMEEFSMEEFSMEKFSTEKFSSKELSYIFMHELTHLKRWDIVYKWLVQMVVCVHWFNPFAYLLQKEVVRACELSCDEAVIAHLDAQAKKAYGDTLLSFVQTKNNENNSMILLTMTEGAEQLKERLGAIMNFRKKSKLVTAMTGVLTICIFIGFQTLGVYAKQDTGYNPPQRKDWNEKDWDMEDWDVEDWNEKDWNEAMTVDWDMVEDPEDKEFYEGVLYDEGDNAYYILGKDKNWSDIPDCHFTDGTIGIVLVKEDGYHTLGPFSETQNIVEEVKKQLQYASENGYGTEEDAKIVLEIAKQLQSGTLVSSNNPYKLKNVSKRYQFYYTQSGYYQKPFVIGIGWNLNEDMKYPDYRQTELTLPDNSKITVYFSEEAKQYADNQEALSAIGTLILQLNAQNPDHLVTMPLINGMDRIDDSRVEEYAENYYQENNLIGFLAVFPMLDKAQQTDYCERVYHDDQVSFWGGIVRNLSQELIVQYSEKAYADEKINFFAVALDYMNPQNVDQYVDKAYKDDKISFFAVAVDHVNIQSVDQYVNKAYEDGRINFFAVALDYMSPQNVDQYAQKAYDKNDIAAFSILTEHMTKAEIEKWLSKAQNDKKSTFYAVLSDY